MNVKIKNILATIVLISCMLPVWSWAASFTVSTSTSIVDGNSFCGGRACTSSDTILIQGGNRKDLLFRNFNGNGSFITIKNQGETPDKKVVITSTSSVGWGTLSFSNCKYLDIRGNNDSAYTYGIKVINNGSTGDSNTVWFYGDCDHIKVSYIEVAFDGNTHTAGLGIKFGADDETSSTVYDTAEIHHNYIHDTRYSGMYLGSNHDAQDRYWIKNFSVHDNLLVNMGSYGITLKGVSSSSNPCLIYNNTIKNTGLIRTDLYYGQHGIGVQYYDGSSYAKIYNNWIENTKGPCVQIGDSNHEVYDNTLLKCGTANQSGWGHGVMASFDNAANVKVYDNIIIQPTRYGVYAQSFTTSVYVDRNKIGDAGIGGIKSSVHIIEGVGADANIYHANVADFHFPIWSDDGDYSNDKFLSTSSSDSSTIPSGPATVVGLKIINVNPN